MRHRSVSAHSKHAHLSTQKTVWAGESGWLLSQGLSLRQSDIAAQAMLLPMTIKADWMPNEKT